MRVRWPLRGRFPKFVARGFALCFFQISLGIRNGISPQGTPIRSSVLFVLILLDGALLQAFEKGGKRDSEPPRDFE